VVAVPRGIARHRRPPSAVDRIALGAIAAVAVAVLATAPTRPALLVAAPLALVSALILARPPRATRLRAVGFGLVGASTVSVILGVLSALAVR
jgi:hypothetical protein